MATVQFPTMVDSNIDWDLLTQLSNFATPSGDEYELSEWIARWIREHVASATVRRLGDNLLVVKGDQPKVAVFAHLDTTGYTLGYENELIRIGSPSPEPDDLLRRVGHDFTARITEGTLQSGVPLLDSAANQPAGSRWVYAAPIVIGADSVCGPYLDNRAGIWVALQALFSCNNIAVAFTSGEESSGHGAVVCGRYLTCEYGIHQAIISDMTWDTANVRRGNGPAISMRDSEVPRRRFLDHVVACAERSGVPFQIEVENSGGSDGTWLHSAGLPIDWVFVGAPEKSPHTSHEDVLITDLTDMARLINALVDALHMQPLNDY